MSDGQELPNEFIPKVTKEYTTAELSKMPKEFRIKIARLMWALPCN